MLQLLKTEEIIFKGTKEEAEEVFNTLSEDLYNVYEKTIEAIAGGYVRKKEAVLAIYNGRYGVGISIFTNLKGSTRYCSKSYVLFDTDYVNLKSIIENKLCINLRAEIREENHKWQ